MTSAGQSGFARSAAALAALRLSEQCDVETMKRGLEYLAARIKDPDTYKLKGHYFFGHFHTSHATNREGASLWRNWYSMTRDSLLRRQLVKGSWSDNEAMSIRANYATANAILILYSAQSSDMKP